MSPLHSRGVPTPSARSKIRSGYLIPAFTAAQKRRNCYVTPAFSGIPNTESREQNQNSSPPQENEIKSGYLSTAFSPAQNKAKMLRHPCILGDPQRQAREATSEVVPNKGGKKLKRLPQTLPSLGRKRYATAAFSGIPNAKRAEQNKKWLPHPCLLGGPKPGGNATSPLHSRGSPTPRARSKMRTRPQQRGTKSKVATSPLPSRRPKTRPKCYVTPAFSGIPNAKRGKQHQKWSRTKG